MVSRRAAISSGYAPPACAGSRLGASGEFPLAARFHLRERFVFQESRRAEGLDQVLFELADLQIAGDADQHGAQVQVGLAAVKAAQALDQGRRDDQHRVGVTIGIADEKPRAVGRRRGTNVQGVPEAREWSGQASW